MPFHLRMVHADRARAAGRPAAPRRVRLARGDPSRVAGTGDLVGTDRPETCPSDGASSSPVAAVLAVGGRVLVMDDDPLVLRAAERVLRQAGFIVEVVSTGEGAIDAVERARELGAQFDVVVLDISVAEGMSGLDAIHHIRSIAPSVRAIVSSGYPDEPAMADHRRFGFDGVVPKPYGVDAFVQVVTELCAAVAPRPG